MHSCPFCQPRIDSVLYETELCVALRDAFPVSSGHTLIVPRRHVVSFFALTAAEQMDMLRLADKRRRDLDADRSPAGYNLGLNDGVVAGQTVLHTHLHLIPRYEGDVVDPRGGVRWVLPKQAPYWEIA